MREVYGFTGKSREFAMEENKTAIDNPFIGQVAPSF